jgi:lipopolysaccharide/colanic/teichoic acid biosynthesis glycosyltransferase
MSATSETRTLRLPLAKGQVHDRAIRLLDIAIGLLTLVVILPILLIAALAIRLSSPGPTIFRQRRLGRDGRPFTVLKFRTMRMHADEKRHRDYVHKLIHGSAERADEARLYKLVVDDRITPVGRLLRKTSLDELPQIFNVLRGDMSLVGPRPVIPYEAEMYPGWYRERFGSKPGITGLWQVSGRNQRTYEEMVELDIEFVRRRTLGLYLGILARTLPVVLFRKGVA